MQNASQSCKNETLILTLKKQKVQIIFKDESMSRFFRDSDLFDVSLVDKFCSSKKCG